MIQEVSINKYLHVKHKINRRLALLYNTGKLLFLTFLHPQRFMTVVGREAEYKSLHYKLTKFITDEINTTIYISGVPGSGKTHTIKQLIKDLKLEIVYVNAGQLKLKTHIFREIYKNLNCEKSKSQTFFTALRLHLQNCDTPHIFIIDEIDLLSSRNQNILYNLTDLMHVENSKLLLICISNTMNLPEKLFESKVCSRIGKNRVDFKPYTHTKLKKLIYNEYKDLNATDLEILTRRIASVCGDVRKVFSLIADKNYKQGINKLINEFMSPLSFKLLPNLSKYQKIVLNVICNNYDNLVPRILYQNFSIFCKTYSFLIIDFYDFINILDKLKLYGIIKYEGYNDKMLLLLDIEDIKSILKTDKDFNFLNSH